MGWWLSQVFEDLHKVSKRSRVREKHQEGNPSKVWKNKGITSIEGNHSKAPEEDNNYIRKPEKKWEHLQEKPLEPRGKLPRHFGQECKRGHLCRKSGCII